jgi:methylenetetrahydrofolate dehydrogenase (NADP+)/methenyltetrahydrofolate cyclohydrolase
VTAHLIDGRRIAAEVRQEIAHEVANLKAAGTTPGLAVVLVGDDPASHIYVANKERACREVGIHVDVHRLDDSITQPELLSLIGALNTDDDVHGILVQLPLPRQVHEPTVIEAVASSKDVDGFHPVNLGRLAIGDPQFIPATPYAVLEMLRREDIDVGGKHAVIVGRSNIVGKPMALAWMQKDKRLHPTVTVCHSFDPDVGVYTSQADVLVVAIGAPDAIRADMVKRGVVVVDIGINRVPDAGDPRGYRIVGDVAFDEVSKVAGAITPVPGGVGPMTVAMLLKNTVQAAQHAHDHAHHAH